LRLAPALLLTGDSQFLARQQEIGVLELVSIDQLLNRDPELIGDPA
jgi:hypothetical protein